MEDIVVSLDNTHDEEKAKPRRRRFVRVFRENSCVCPMLVCVCVCLCVCVCVCVLSDICSVYK